MNSVTKTEEMKSIIEKIYHCDFCKKYGRSASVVSRHEKYCRFNPNNRHKCFDMCVHLGRERIINRPYGYNYTEFTCGVTGQKMYSYQLEKKQSLWVFKKILHGIRMPLACDLYKEMSYDEQCNRFNI